MQIVTVQHHNPITPTLTTRKSANLLNCNNLYIHIRCADGICASSFNGCEYPSFLMYAYDSHCSHYLIESNSTL